MEQGKPIESQVEKSKTMSKVEHVEWLTYSLRSLLVTTNYPMTCYHEFGPSLYKVKWNS